MWCGQRREDDDARERKQPRTARPECRAHRNPRAVRAPPRILQIECNTRAHCVTVNASLNVKLSIRFWALYIPIQHPSFCCISVVWHWQPLTKNSRWLAEDAHPCMTHHWKQICPLLLTTRHQYAFWHTWPRKESSIFCNLISGDVEVRCRSCRSSRQPTDG